MIERAKLIGIIYSCPKARRPKRTQLLSRKHIDAIYLGRFEDGEPALELRFDCPVCSGRHYILLEGNSWVD